MTSASTQALERFTRANLGGITTARAVEHYFLLFAVLMGALRTPTFNIAITC